MNEGSCFLMAGKKWAPRVQQLVDSSVAWFQGQSSEKQGAQTKNVVSVIVTGCFVFCLISSFFLKACF
jgi:hypothetical protein